LITLAIDTSETRGSVAVLRGSECLAHAAHSDGTDYSEWLIPVVERVLRDAGIRHETVDLYAACTGPGSFTGVRVGLTTVKAWCEVYGKRVVAVSRLEALAFAVRRPAGIVAASYDAQRGQVFGGLYRSLNGRLERMGEEVVVSPEGFLELVAGQADECGVQWVSLDPEVITGLEGWGERVKRGDVMRRGPDELAATIGGMALVRAEKGEFADPLELDANYVRRSDAEIFWKGPAAHVR
jgi:tRNA threonylcarbamoyladenosine biosynthesis protein TsaB